MERSSDMLYHSTARKINDWMSLLVWWDRMHILNRFFPIQIDRIISASFTIGNLLNMETGTIKRRLWLKVRSILCFISDPKFFEQVTVTLCSLIMKFHTISEKILKTYWFNQSRSPTFLHQCRWWIELYSFHVTNLQKCKFFKMRSNTRSFL